MLQLQEHHFAQHHWEILCQVLGEEMLIYSQIQAEGCSMWFLPWLKHNRSDFHSLVDLEKAWEYARDVYYSLAISKEVQSKTFRNLIFDDPDCMCTGTFCASVIPKRLKQRSISLLARVALK